ncbi:hypothetical protein CPB85DRAFT_1429737 [Mucidula mucida]|nr:hypothetical protein CPB85DRAFT_1429737 [Mucidula mucida]
MRPSSPHVPVAVFGGGTSGVGEAMMNTISSYTGDNRIHLVIVGRNGAAASNLQTARANSFYANWMKTIKTTCQELKKLLAKTNFLVSSVGYFRMTGRVETKEGLDQIIT